jgi:heterodisulfide reductase subunit A
VPVVVKGISSIDPRGCKGCGICAAECPAKAIVFKHYTDDQVNAQAGGKRQSIPAGGSGA